MVVQNEEIMLKMVIFSKSSTYMQAEIRLQQYFGGRVPLV